MVLVMNLDMEWKDKREVKIGTYGEHLVQKELEKSKWSVYKNQTDKGEKFDFLCEKDNKAILVEVKTKPYMTVGKYLGLTGIDMKDWEKYNKIKESINKKLYIFFVDALHKTIRFGNFDFISEPVVINDVIFPMDCNHFKNPMTLFHPEQLTTVRELTNEEIYWLKTKSKSRSFS